MWSSHASKLRNALAAVVRDFRFPQAQLTAEIQTSEKDGERLSDWWEKQHLKKAKYWLSGSRPGRVWSLLEVTGHIKPGARVLDVGVGFGYAAQKLRRSGCLVDALDVSPAALDRVARFTDTRFTPEDLASLPSARYDLAISFLVAQHMSNADLENQLVHVIRSMKIGGILAIQVSFPLHGESHEDTTERQKAGMVMRTDRDFSSLISAAGGRILWQKEIGRFKEFGSGWMAYHIIRA